MAIEKKIYTDYSFVIQLGDKPRQQAPIREVKILAYDGNKYVTIEVEGWLADVKFGYLYYEPKRCGETPFVTPKEIEAILKSRLELPASKKESK